MAITPSGHRHSWAHSLLPTFALAMLSSAVFAADRPLFRGIEQLLVQPVHETPVIRGQSPYAAYPSYYTPGPQTFVDTPSPWITVSQPDGGPAPAYNSPTQTAQAPVDPFAQPYNGVDSYGGGMNGTYDPGMQGYFGDSPAVWQPYAAMQGNFGNERSMGIGQLMMPIYQDGQSLIFADIRGRYDDQDSYEGNFGLAMRQLVDPNWFYGIYGFYDFKHSSFGNDFQQGAFGIEAMSVMWEGRFNGYIPESGAKAAPGASTADFSGGTIFVNGGFERAYYGVDGEIGGLIHEDWGGNLEFRGFVGGYWFDSSGNNTKSVAGPKGRLEMRLYDTPWFGPESRLTFGVEVQNDSVRDFQVAGIARLEIPLGFFQGGRKLTRIERRMLDRIVRDDDVITVTETGSREVGIDPLTNKPLTNVNLVDATTADIQTIANFGAPNDMILVDGSQGTITRTAAFNLQNGQILRGAGFQVIGSETGSTATFGTRPTINNTNAAANTVVLANNSTVADLDLTGGDSGIQSNAALTGILVSGNTVTGASDDGLEFQALDATSTIQNNTSTGSGGDGFEFNGTFSGRLIGNAATGNGDNGIDFIDNIAPTALISGNRAELNNSHGFEFNLFSGTMQGAVTGNISANNGFDATGAIVNPNADGFAFLGNVSGIVNGNTSHNNSQAGYFIEGLQATGTVSNNTATGNPFAGFFFNTSVAGTVSGNTATGSGVGAYGFDFVNGTANLAATARVTGNTATSNDGGFGFNGIAAGALINGNSAGGNGFLADGTPLAGAVSGNGFEFFQPNFGVVTGNFALGNANNGFSGAGDANFVNAAGATFSNNTANTNGDRGYRGANAGAAASNVGADNENGGNTFP